MVTTHTNAEPTRVERALRIRRTERPLVGWLVALFTVIQASHGFGINAADALFFERFGVDQLPLMILLSGPAVMISVLGHSSGIAARGTARWLPTVTFACAVWAAGEWAGILTGSRAVYPIIWISTQVLMMVSLTVMWNAAGAACTSRQAKRLFPIFATAGIAGGVLGNFLTGTLAGVLGTQNLLLVQAGLLLTGALLLVRGRDLFEGDDDDEEHAKSTLKGLSETVQIIRSSRFLRITAGVAVAIFCLFHLVYFPFSETVARSFENEAETATFLGIFSAIATAATFLFSLFVTNRLFARLGLVVTLMIVPAVYAVGFGTWLMVFTLESAATFRLVQWVTVNAVALTAYNALFNVVSRHRRGQVNAFMTAVPAQIGVSLAGLLLMATAAMPIETVFVIGLVISLLTLSAAVVLRKEYLNAVVSAVRRGVVGLLDVPSQAVFTPTDADAIRVLKDRLRDPRPAARALAVAGLGRLGEQADAADLEPFLADSDPRVRSAAFDSVCAIEPGRVSNHAERAIDDEVPEVRLQVIHFLAAQADDESAAIARPALSDPDARVRAAAASLVGGEEGEEAIAALLADDEPRGVTAVLTETAKETSAVSVDPLPYLDHYSPVVREAATRASVDLDPSALRPGLDDRSPRVRSATAATLAKTPEGREILVDVLGTGSVSASESALKALTPLEELPGELTDWARREAERAAFLLSHADALRQTKQPTAAHDYLLRVLDNRSHRLTQWVLMAMTTSDTRTVMPLVARGVESSDPDTQSQAIEALESIGAKDVMEVLLPLLESEDTPQDADAGESLRELSNDFDPWLRRLAAIALEADDDGTGDSLPSLSSMDEDLTRSILDTLDRVLILQRVHMFSELDPEDLDLIAQATSEEVHEPGAPIFLEGEAGDEMLVIVEGSAVVTVPEGSSTRLIEEYGPGDHVGELSLLTGGPRSANVHAGEEGARGLALTATDLLTVLEERPTVAVGMLGTLAKRLIEQT